MEKSRAHLDGVGDAGVGDAEEPASGRARREPVSRGEPFDQGNEVLLEVCGRMLRREGSASKEER